MVSILQYVFSIAVIVIHSGRLFESEPLHFLAKSVFGRMAVPYFMVCSSFFLKNHATQGRKVKEYFQSLIKKYLIWTVLYLPYGYFYFSNSKLPSYYLFPGFFIGLFYTGMSYHLWYIPAFIFGWFLLQGMLRVFGKKMTGLLVFLLYSFGAMETYSLFIEHTTLGNFFTSYLAIFQTSRNFLFYVPAYLYTGCLLYDFYQNDFMKKYGTYFLVASFVGLASESTLIYFNQGIDKNFIVFSIPFAFFLFHFSLSTKILGTVNFSKLKQLSSYYYFIHPIFIEFFLFVLGNINLQPHEEGLMVFILTLVSSHLIGKILVLAEFLMQEKIWKKEYLEAKMPRNHS